MSNKVMKILLDMDGVLTDFVGAAIEKFSPHPKDQLLKEWPLGEYDITKVLRVDPDYFWTSLSVEWWSTLPFTSFAKDLIQLAGTLGEVYILSSPGNAIGAMGKMNFLKKKLPAFLLLRSLPTRTR
jgi:5'(3')-deoxyribonucleotidase